MATDVASRPVLRVYNEGLLALLYDRGAEAAIRRRDPAVVHGAGPQLLDDRATRELLAAGTLLVFGLRGDGDLALEVMIAAPGEDLPGVQGLAHDTGALDLPSGRLCLHSYNSLPMGDNGTAPADPGAMLAVPPGRYRVDLYRPAVTGEDAGDAPDLLVLTPQPAADAGTCRNVLFGECIGVAADSTAEPAVSEGSWTGRVLHADDGASGMLLSLDAADAAALGLVRGARLRLSSGQHTLEVCHHGVRKAYDSTRTMLGEAALAALAPGEIAHGMLDESATAAARLRLLPGAERASFFDLGEGSVVSARVVGPPCFVPPAPAAIRKGVISGAVVGGTPGSLLLNIDEAAVARLKPKREEPLRLEAAGCAWTVHYLMRPRAPTAAETAGAPAPLRCHFVEHLGANDAALLYVAPVVGEVHLPARVDAQAPQLPAGTPVRLFREAAGA